MIATQKQDKLKLSSPKEVLPTKDSRIEYSDKATRLLLFSALNMGVIL